MVEPKLLVEFEKAGIEVPSLTLVEWDPKIAVKLRGNVQALGLTATVLEGDYFDVDPMQCAQPVNIFNPDLTGQAKPEDMRRLAHQVTAGPPANKFVCLTLQARTSGRSIASNRAILGNEEGYNYRLGIQHFAEEVYVRNHWCQIETKYEYRNHKRSVTMLVVMIRVNTREGLTTDPPVLEDLSDHYIKQDGEPLGDWSIKARTGFWDGFPNFNSKLYDKRIAAEARAKARAARAVLW